MATITVDDIEWTMFKRDIARMESQLKEVLESQQDQSQAESDIFHDIRDLCRTVDNLTTKLGEYLSLMQADVISHADPSMTSSNTRIRRISEITESGLDVESDEPVDIFGNPE